MQPQIVPLVRVVINASARTTCHENHASAKGVSLVRRAEHRDRLVIRPQRARWTGGSCGKMCALLVVGMRHCQRWR